MVSTGLFAIDNSIPRRRLLFRDGLDPGRMAGGFEEPHQIRARDAHEIGGAEGEAAGGGQARCSDLSSITASSSAVTRNSAPFLEQVLGMAARNGSTQLLRLLHVEQRGMRHGRVGDAVPVEEGEEVGRSGGHVTLIDARSAFSEVESARAASSAPGANVLHPNERAL